MALIEALKRGGGRDVEWKVIILIIPSRPKEWTSMDVEGIYGDLGSGGLSPPGLRQVRVDGRRG
jgi:hypothetical protein